MRCAHGPVVLKTSVLTLDRDQLGLPVWLALGFHPERSIGRGRFSRYDDEGPARYRELVAPLLAKAAAGDFESASGVKSRDAMKRAFAEARQDIARGDDVGSALVVAIALAIRSRPPGGARIY